MSTEQDLVETLNSIQDKLTSREKDFFEIDYKALCEKYREIKPKLEKATNLGHLEKPHPLALLKFAHPEPSRLPQ